MNMREPSEVASYTSTNPQSTYHSSPRKEATSTLFASEYSGSTFQAIRNSISVTPLGCMTMLVGYGVYDHFGANNQDMILKILGLAFALVALIFVLLAYLEWYRVFLKLNQSDPTEFTEVEVGQTLLTGFSIPSINLNPLFQLKVSWVKPHTSDYQLELYQSRLHELVSPVRRGRLTSVVRKIQLEDLFGLSEITWYMRQRCDLKFLPQSTQLSPLRIQQPQEGEDLYDPAGQAQGDLVELRRYTDGDPLRWLLWRVYARNRQLIVRSPERAFSLKRDLIAYFVAHPTDEASASTARAYLEAGMLGETYQFFADGCLGSAHHQQGGIDHLLSSAQGETLDALDQVLALEARQLNGCVIFASALTPTHQLLELIEAIPGSPFMILSLPLELNTTSDQRSWWRHVWFNHTESSSHHTWKTLTSEDVELVLHNIEQVSAYARPPILLTQPEGQEVSADILREFYTA